MDLRAEPEVFILVETRRCSRCSRCTPGTRTFFDGQREILEEGDDPQGPLQRPVHWSIERRGQKTIYCSTYQMTAEEVRRFPPGFIKPSATGGAPVLARIESDTNRESRPRCPIHPDATRRMMDLTVDPDVFILHERSGRRYRLTLNTATFFEGDREILEEDDHQLAGLPRPVHWSIERRDERIIYCSTFNLTAEELRQLPDVMKSQLSGSSAMHAAQVTARIETDITSIESNTEYPTGMDMHGRSAAHSDGQYSQQGKAVNSVLDLIVVEAGAGWAHARKYANSPMSKLSRTTQ